MKKSCCFFPRLTETSQRPPGGHRFYHRPTTTTTRRYYLARVRRPQLRVDDPPAPVQQVCPAARPPACPPPHTQRRVDPPHCRRHAKAWRGTQPPFVNTQRNVPSKAPRCAFEQSPSPREAGAACAGPAASASRGECRGRVGGRSCGRRIAAARGGWGAAPPCRPCPPERRARATHLARAAAERRGATVELWTEEQKRAQTCAKDPPSGCCPRQ